VVVYRGSNQPPDHPHQKATPPATAAKPGPLYYGYRSLPLQWADPQPRFSLVLRDHFQSAEVRAEGPATAELCALALLYPTLHGAAVAGDAGFGYDLP
jgi:hypothetical protein